MKITSLIAAAGGLLLTAGLAGGITASQAQAQAAPPEGSAIVHVTGQPVQGGGGVWANASYTQFESLFLVNTKVVTVGSLGDSTATPVVPAVIGETVYTYLLNVRDFGYFRAIPWAYAPNQSGRYPVKIRGAASGDLKGWSTYRLVIDLTGTVKNPIVTDPALATPQKVIDMALAKPAVAFSTTYTAHGLQWTYTPGYWRTLVKGHWAHFKATKHHKAYSKWIPAKRLYVQGTWTPHPVTQRWTDSSWNNNGQSRSAGNITGFFGRHYTR